MEASSQTASALRKPGLDLCQSKALALLFQIVPRSLCGPVPIKALPVGPTQHKLEWLIAGCQCCRNLWEQPPPNSGSSMLSLLPHYLQERPLCPLWLSPQMRNPSCPSKALLSTEEHELWSQLLGGSSSKQSESLPRYLTLLCPLQVTPPSPVLFPHPPGSLFSQGRSNMKLTSETLRMSAQEGRAD